MSKLLADQIANYDDNGPIEIKEGLNIASGKPLQVAGSAGSNGNVLVSSGTTVSWSNALDNSGNWDDAHGWGNHASAGYLTSVPALALDGLSNVDATTGLQNGSILKYNGASWEAAPDLNDNDNTTYVQSAQASGSNVNLRLTGSDATNDDILVTAGTNVTFSSVTVNGFTIDAAGGGGGLSNIVDDTSPELGGTLDMKLFTIQADGGGINNTLIGGDYGNFPSFFGHYQAAGALGWQFRQDGTAICRADGGNSDGTGINALQIGNFTDLSCLTVDGTGALSTKASLNVAANSGTTGTGSKISIGATGQLELYHTSNNSSGVRSTGGVFAIQNQMNTGNNNWDKAIQLQAYGDIQLRHMAGADAVYCTSGGAVSLYHNGSGPKLATDAGGVDITGGIVDKDSNLGTAGQVLSSTGTELEWVTSSSINNTTTNGTNSLITTTTTSGSNVNAIEIKTDNNTASAVRWRFTPPGHFIPNVNAAYDIGNAEYKVRHLFLSDNTLYFEGSFLKVAQHDNGGSAQTASYLIPLAKLKDTLNASADYEAFKTAILAITDA